MELEILPEPTRDERRAVLAALAREDAAASAYASRWRAAALDDLRRDAAAEDSRRDARVIEP